MNAVALLVAGLSLAAQNLVFAAAKPGIPSGPPVPEDLGAATIDASSYPAEFQETYRKIFVPAFKQWGTAARAINSPIVELDETTERSERLAHPGLFADSRIAEPTRNGWKKYVEGLYRKPACCGACPTLTLEQARALRRFLVYDSLVRKTGPRADAWIAHRKDLITRFEKLHGAGSVEIALKEKSKP